MMNIQEIQFLRQETGAGIMDCKNALIETNGDLDRSLEILLKRGFQIVKKKAERTLSDGIAFAKLYGDKAVILEVSTETDFVATNKQFISYVESIADTIACREPNDPACLMGCTLEEQNITVTELLQKMVLTFGENIAIKRFDTLTGQMPVAYMHQQGKYAVILNMASDRRFDRTELSEIGKELAMQIAAMSPQYVSRSGLSDETLAEIKAQIAQEVKEDPALSRKPVQVLDKIVSGRIEKYLASNCLLEQEYIRDDSLTVGQFIKSAAGTAGQIEVTEFYRYEKS